MILKDRVITKCGIAEMEIFDISNIQMMTL